MGRVVLIVSVVALIAVIHVAVQAQETGTVSRIYITKPRPGMDAEWLAAAAEHIEWHRQAGDTWTWIAFYIETGEYTGSYGWVTMGHEWSDFDEYDATLGAGDGENVTQTFGPLSDSVTSWFTESLPATSNPPTAGSGFPLMHMIRHRVDPAQEDAFLAAVAKAHAALQEGGFAPFYTWHREIGAEGPTYTLALPLQSWADMAEPERGVAEILEEALGRFESEGLMSAFAGAVVSTDSWIARTLPDLSCCGNR